MEPEVPQASEGPGAAGIVIGAAALLGVAGVGYGIYTGQVRKRRAEAQRQAAMKKRAAQQSRTQAGAAAGTAAARTGSTINNSTAASQHGSTINNSTAATRPGSTISNSTVPGGTGSAPSNTGSASRTPAQSPYARPASQNGTGSQPASGASTATRKPYENTVENPYGRYSTKDGEDPDYTASFRPSESRPITPDDDEPQAFTASFRSNGEGDTTPRRRRRSE